MAANSAGLTEPVPDWTKNEKRRMVEILASDIALMTASDE
jgi:hypothetical protein